MIRIRWDSLNLQVRAKMLRDINSYASNEFVNNLPQESIQSHAVVAGGQIYCAYPLILDTTKCNFEDMAKQKIGRINIEPQFQYLSVNYDEITESVPALAIAQVIEEDIHILKKVGDMSWHNLLYESSYNKVIFEEVE